MQFVVENIERAMGIMARLVRRDGAGLIEFFLVLERAYLELVAGRNKRHADAINRARALAENSELRRNGSRARSKGVDSQPKV